MEAAPSHVGSCAPSGHRCPDFWNSKIETQEEWNESIAVDLEHWEFGRYVTAIALLRHDAKGALPGHELWEDELTLAQSGEASVREFTSEARLATEDAAGKRVDTREVVGFGRVDRDIGHSLSQYLSQLHLWPVGVHGRLVSRVSEGRCASRR